MIKLEWFEHWLTVSTFVQRAYTELEGLSTDEYFLRDDNATHKLMDEILPLAAFLKHFERPSRFVKCRWLPGYQNFDAKLKLKGYEVEKGFLDAAYFVEATSAQYQNSFLIREALARYGAIGGSSVRRIGSKKKGNDQIVGAGGSDIDSPVTDAIEWIKTALTKKYDKKEPYPNPCLLIVQVEPTRPLNLLEWSTVAKGIQSTVDRSKFRATYLVNWWTNDVFQV